MMTVVGEYEPKTPIYTVDTATMRRVMNTGFEAAFCTPHLALPSPAVPFPSFSSP